MQDGNTLEGHEDSGVDRDTEIDRGSRNDQGGQGVPGGCTRGVQEVLGVERVLAWMKNIRGGWAKLG